MSRRLTVRLAAAVITLALAGCTDAEIGAFVAALGESPAPAVPGAPGVPGTVTPAGVVGARAERDRPDEQAGNQVHVFYVVPSDVTDRQLDTNGTIDGWMRDAAAWLQAKTGGRALRTDTFGGKPDITFFRTKRTEAELFAREDKLLDDLDDEIRRAGHNDPLKANVYFYDGRCGRPNTAGLGGGLAAGVFLPTSVKQDMTMLHEVFHALGAVAEGAPNRADDAHVTDDPDDVMAAKQTLNPAVLDSGNNDYYGHGRSDRFDLATSPFLDPLPPGVIPAKGVPTATTLDAGAATFQPAWAIGGQAGDTAVEAVAATFIDAERQAQGLPSLPVDERLREAARRTAASATAIEPGDALRLAGYAGTGGTWTITMTLGDDADPASAVRDYMAEFRDKFSGWYDKAGLTDAAFGASVKGRQVKLVLVQGTRAFDVEGVRLGASPLGTRTLVGRIRARAGQTHDRIRLMVDDQYTVHTYWLKAGEFIEFHATIPAAGRHEVKVLAGQPGSTSVSRVTSFQLDGARPLETAFVGE
jgi:hypothetical protein